MMFWRISILALAIGLHSAAAFFSFVPKIGGGAGTAVGRSADGGMNFGVSGSLNVHFPAFQMPAGVQKAINMAVESASAIPNPAKVVGAALAAAPQQLDPSKVVSTALNAAQQAGAQLDANVSKYFPNGMNGVKAVINGGVQTVASGVDAIGAASRGDLIGAAKSAADAAAYGVATKFGPEYIAALAGVDAANAGFNLAKPVISGAVSGISGIGNGLNLNSIPASAFANFFQLPNLGNFGNFDFGKLIGGANGIDFSKVPNFAGDFDPTKLFGDFSKFFGGSQFPGVGFPFPAIGSPVPADVDNAISEEIGSQSGDQVDPQEVVDAAVEANRQSAKPINENDAIAAALNAAHAVGAPVEPTLEKYFPNGMNGVRATLDNGAGAIRSAFNGLRQICAGDFGGAANSALNAAAYGVAAKFGPELIAGLAAVDAANAGVNLAKPVIANGAQMIGSSMGSAAIPTGIAPATFSTGLPKFDPSNVFDISKLFPNVEGLVDTPLFVGDFSKFLGGAQFPGMGFPFPAIGSPVPADVMNAINSEINTEAQSSDQIDPQSVVDSAVEANRQSAKPIAENDAIAAALNAAHGAGATVESNVEKYFPNGMNGVRATINNGASAIQSSFDAMRKTMSGDFGGAATSALNAAAYAAAAKFGPELVAGLAAVDAANAGVNLAKPVIANGAQMIGSSLGSAAIPNFSNGLPGFNLPAFGQFPGFGDFKFPDFAQFLKSGSSELPFPAIASIIPTDVMSAVVGAIKSQGGAIDAQSVVDSAIAANNQTEQPADQSDVIAAALNAAKGAGATISTDLSKYFPNGMNGVHSVVDSAVQAVASAGNAVGQTMRGDIGGAAASALNAAAYGAAVKFGPELIAGLAAVDAANAAVNLARPFLNSALKSAIGALSAVQQQQLDAPMANGIPALFAVDSVFNAIGPMDSNVDPTEIIQSAMSKFADLPAVQPAQVIQSIVEAAQQAGANFDTASVKQFANDAVQRLQLAFPRAASSLTAAATSAGTGWTNLQAAAASAMSGDAAAATNAIGNAAGNALSAKMQTGFAMPMAAMDVVDSAMGKPPAQWA